MVKLLDELGIEVTPERIAELREHFQFRSDSGSRDVGLVLDALQVALAEVTAERDKAVRVAVGLEHDYAGANAEREEMRERGDRIEKAADRMASALVEVEEAYGRTPHKGLMLEVVESVAAYRASGQKE